MSKLKIRYYGHVGQVTGYGVAASDLCMALLRHPQVDLQIVPLQQDAAVAGRFLPLASHLRRSRDAGLEPLPDVVVVHTLPLDCRRVLEIEGLLPPGGRSANQILVAQTTWETTGLAPVVDQLMCFDQVWSPSHASLAALYSPEMESAGNMPARRLIPHCFDEVQWQLSTRPFDLRDDSRFCFYYVGAARARKNLQGLLRAWAFAFAPTDDVLLRIVSTASDPVRAAMLAQTGLRADELAPIEWRSGLSDDAIQSLHWISGDCFVTATRGEAWNLPAFDAMLAGRHVISPFGLGSDDYLRDTSAELYAATSTPAWVDIAVRPPTSADPAGGFNLQMVGAQGLTSRCLWREPDLADLAARMRSARAARWRNLHRKYNPIERYGYEAVAQLVVDTLMKGDLKQ